MKLLDFRRTKPKPGQMVVLNGIQDGLQFYNDIVEILYVNPYIIVVDIQYVLGKRDFRYNVDRSFPGKKCWTIYYDTIDITPYSLEPFTDKEMEEIFI